MQGEKCCIRVSKMKYLDHLAFRKGMVPDPEKVPLLVIAIFLIMSVSLKAFKGRVLQQLLYVNLLTLLLHFMLLQTKVLHLYG